MSHTFLVMLAAVIISSVFPGTEATRGWWLCLGVAVAADVGRIMWAARLKS